MCALLPVVIEDARAEKAYGGKARAGPGVSASAFKEQRLLTSHLHTPRWDPLTTGRFFFKMSPL